jgi:hypothetical protein
VWSSTPEPACVIALLYIESFLHSVPAARRRWILRSRACACFANRYSPTNAAWCAGRAGRAHNRCRARYVNDADIPRTIDCVGGALSCRPRLPSRGRCAGCRTVPVATSCTSSSTAAGPAWRATWLSGSHAGSRRRTRRAPCWCPSPSARRGCESGASARPKCSRAPSQRGGTRPSACARSRARAKRSRRCC